MSDWHWVVLCCSSCGRKIKEIKINSLSSSGDTTGVCACKQPYRYGVSHGVVSGNVDVKEK